MGIESVDIFVNGDCKCMQQPKLQSCQDANAATMISLQHSYMSLQLSTDSKGDCKHDCCNEMSNYLKEKKKVFVN